MRINNPVFQKLSSCLKRSAYSINISKAYFLFGTPYSQSVVSNLKNAITKNQLDLYRKQSVSYDTLVDNIELYLVENDENRFFIVFLLDYYELYYCEEILDIFPVENIDCEKDLIYK